MGCFYTFGNEHGFLENVRNKTELINHLFTTESLKVIDVYVTGNGKILDDCDPLVLNHTYHISPRLVGGKGGFGSMLRAIGAQIEKTTSREACRDLSGRRMRDVNNEKKLKDWLAKESDREREKEEKRKERMEQRRRKPQHKFDDATYVEQKNKVVEDLEDALQRGLEKAKTASATVTSETAGCSGLSRKRKATNKGSSDKSKKNKGWLGLDPSLNLSDLDTSEEEEDENSSASDDSKSSSRQSTENDKPSDLTNKEGIADDISKESNSTAAPSNDKPTELSSSSDTNSKTSLLSKLPSPTNEMNEEKEDLSPINLDDYNSSKDLEAAGLNRLKSALMERGLKCGGTLTQRAERLYSVKRLTPDKIAASLFAKPLKKK